MRYRSFMVFLISVILILGLFSLPATAQDIADTIQKQYTTVSSFQTDFSQTLTNAASGSKEQREGTIWYQEPTLIRWHTTSPEEEVLISTGKTVWDYFPEEKVAYRYSLEGRFNSKTMLRFISGEVNLQEDFQVEVLGSDQENANWTKVKLIPKNPDPSLVEATIWVDPESSLIQQVMLVDFFGNQNQLTFQDIDLNVHIADSHFTFQPPEDVQVMQGGGQ
ncbi:outer membrane lipoprotein chaperone LolA [Desulfovermiculus halophilus]|uniref:outer membrane lipoprotein chaperone LolA n=1 Tax=Desulfovermiculus halophilus TaxID=339722 RepID=UPI000489CF46|nr:outer membrane lipoprotein chaperone LolA [Desulfovermiculus halophilus]